METSIKITLIIVAAVLVIAGVFGFIYWKSANPTNTINTQGDATIKATPDLVSVYFNVQTSGTTAQVAKDKNSEIVDNVITNLIKAGLERSEIITENFNVYEDFDWNNGNRISKGFKATHSIKVKVGTDKMDLVGKIIDGGVDGGALISYINFELSPEKENEYKALALKKASEDARIKAEAIASGMGKKIGDLASVSESNFGYNPWRLYAASAEMGTADVAMAKQATNVQPGEKDIQASISTVFEIN